jgi:uncharacterized protein (DUF2225 family)
MKKNPAKKTRCPLCGHIFSREEPGCGGKCGLLGDCGLSCCPQCGYSFVTESRVVRLFKNLLDGRKEKEPKP